MAESGKGLSKSAKKNLKRREKKQAAAALTSGSHRDDDVITPQQIKEILTQEINDARQAKDQEKLKVLREQLWVINDLIAGVQTDMPEEELAKILENLPMPKIEKKEQVISDQKVPETGRKVQKERESENKMAAKVETQPQNGVANEAPPLSSEAPVPPEKRLRNLKKKLTQIEKIKEKVAAGESVEKSQLDKLQTEDRVREEVEELEIEIGLLKLSW